MQDNIKTLFANDRHDYTLSRAKEIIQWYREGSDLTEEEIHIHPKQGGETKPCRLID